MTFKKSIILSNILDPFTKNPTDHLSVIKKLIESGKYDAIETRLISDVEAIEYLKLNKNDMSVEYYITGDLSRAGLSLSDDSSAKAIRMVKDSLVIASESNADFLGIASGTNNENMLKGLDIFVNSLCEIFEFIKDNKLNIRLAIEPLDQFAHKKNVIGSLDFTLRLIKKLESLGYNENNFILTFDTAHVALNEDDFEETIMKLSKYIYKLHFADAVLDKNQKEYGDYHMNFGKGFINPFIAKKIIKLLSKYCSHDVEIAVEIREKDVDHAWILEQESYEFLEKAFN